MTAEGSGMCFPMDVCSVPAQCNNFYHPYLCYSLLTSQYSSSSWALERASPGFSNSDSPGKSHCSSVFLFLPPSPPVCVHPLLLPVSSASPFPLKLCRAEGSWQEGMLTALIWGRIEGSSLLSWRGQNGAAPADNFAMSLKQLPADLAPFLLHSWFILPLLLCSVYKQCLA